MVEERRKRGRPSLVSSGRDATDRQPSQPGRATVVSTRLDPEETDQLYQLAGMARMEMSAFLRQILQQLLRDRQHLLAARQAARDHADRQDDRQARRPVPGAEDRPPSRGGTWGR